MKHSYKYYYNSIENSILDAMYKTYGRVTPESCVLDVSSSFYWPEYYLNYLNASLVTFIDFNASANSMIANKYADDTRIDFLSLDLQENIGAFRKQYDIINAIKTMYKIVDDTVWLRTVENLCSYLKPGGLFLVSGDFSKTTYGNSYEKHRSEGVWKALLSNNNCTLQDILVNDSQSITKQKCNLLVARKL